METTTNTNTNLAIGAILATIIGYLITLIWPIYANIIEINATNYGSQLKMDRLNITYNSVNNAIINKDSLTIIYQQVIVLTNDTINDLLNKIDVLGKEIKEGIRNGDNVSEKIARYETMQKKVKKLLDKKKNETEKLRVNHESLLGSNKQLETEIINLDSTNRIDRTLLQTFIEANCQ